MKPTSQVFGEDKSKHSSFRNDQNSRTVLWRLTKTMSGFMFVFEGGLVKDSSSTTKNRMIEWNLFVNIYWHRTCSTFLKSVIEMRQSKGLTFRELLTKSWLSENKWHDIRENLQMNFPAEANLKPYFGEMNFAERFLQYNTII